MKNNLQSVFILCQPVVYTAQEPFQLAECVYTGYLFMLTSVFREITIVKSSFNNPCYFF